MVGTYKVQQLKLVEDYLTLDSLDAGKHMNRLDYRLLLGVSYRLLTGDGGDI